MVKKKILCRFASATVIHIYTVYISIRKKKITLYCSSLHSPSYVPPPPITSVTPVSRDSSESNSNKTNMGGMINIEEDDEENDFNLVMSDY